MGDHDIIIEPLTALALVLLGTVSSEVHGSGVIPHEEGLAFFMSPVDKVKGSISHLIIDGLHPFPGEGACVHDLLPSLAVRPAMQDAPRPKSLLEGRVFGVIGIFRLLFGIEVIEIAEKFVKSVHRGQELVLVAQMIFAELAGGVALGF